MKALQAQVDALQARHDEVDKLQKRVHTALRGQCAVVLCGCAGAGTARLVRAAGRAEFASLGAD